MKKCFTCDRRYPLFMFSKDKMKYQRPYDQGRVRCCRICNYKRWNKLRSDWFYNVEIGKFQRVEFKSKWEIIKEVLS